MTSNNLGDFFYEDLEPMCVINYEGQFNDANAAFLKLFGYSQKDIIGKPFIHFIHEDDIQLTLDAAKNMSSGKSANTFQNRIKISSGPYKWVEWTTRGNIEHRTILAIARDITDIQILYKITQRISESMDMKVLLPQLCDTLIEYLQFDGLALYTYNDQSKLLECKVSHGLSESLFDHIQVIPKGFGVSGHAIETGSVIYMDLDNYTERDLITLLRNLNFSHLASIPFIFKGRIMGAVTLLFKKDKSFKPSERGLYEAIGSQIAIALHNSKLLSEIMEDRKVAEYAKVKIEEAMHVKSEFLANISHEIRTPLNAILGYSEVLSKEHLPSHITQYISGIQVSGKSLLTLLNDILDLSKLESHKMEVYYQPIDLIKLIEEVRVIFSQSCEQKDIGLYFETPKEHIPIFMLDEVRVRQILVNLVGNAVKFTNKGHVSIHLNLKRQQTGNQVEISVTDTGIGINAHDLVSIFDAFKQQSSTDSRNFEGTGLGLAICKRLSEILHGEITVHSLPQRGSTFTLKLFNVMSPSEEHEHLVHPLSQSDTVLRVNESTPTSFVLEPLDIRVHQQVKVAIIPMLNRLSVAIKKSDIKALSAQLLALSIKYELPHLEEHAHELEHLLKSYDIPAIKDQIRSLVDWVS